MLGQFSPADFLMNVDRSRPISRPEGFYPRYKKFESTGFRSYHLDAVHLHDVPPRVFFADTIAFFDGLNAVKYCWSCHDGQALQEMGPEIFYRFFGDTALLLLKSASMMEIEEPIRWTIVVPFLALSSNGETVAQYSVRAEDMVQSGFRVPFFPCKAKGLASGIWMDVDWEEIPVSESPDSESLFLPFFDPELPADH